MSPPTKPPPLSKGHQKNAAKAIAVDAASPAVRYEDCFIKLSGPRSISPVLNYCLSWSRTAKRALCNHAKEGRPFRAAMGLDRRLAFDDRFRRMSSTSSGPHLKSPLVQHSSPVRRRE